MNATEIQQHELEHIVVDILKLVGVDSAYITFYISSDEWRSYKLSNWVLVVLVQKQKYQWFYSNFKSLKIIFVSMIKSLEILKDKEINKAIKQYLQDKGLDTKNIENIIDDYDEDYKEKVENIKRQFYEIFSLINKKQKLKKGSIKK